MKSTELKIFIGLSVMLFLILMLFGAISNYNREHLVVAITFDTEYHDNYLDAINTSEQDWINTMYELKNIAVRNNIQFQFNVMGITAEKYPGVIKELANSGQGISCHSYDHPFFTELTKQEMRNQLSLCKSIVSNVSGKEVIGNRFPYTMHNKESFEALVLEGYKYDSSLLISELGTDRPRSYKGVLEIPVANIHDDWGYFVYENNQNATQFYNNFEQRISTSKGVFVIILHPWVLAQDPERVSELENFIIRLQEQEIPIKNLDQIYRGY